MKVSDEQIVAALLTNGTLKATAAVLGISERTIYDRMKDGDFQALYKSAKADLIRAAVFHINAQLQEAIDVVVSIMHDEATNAAVRLQAAQTILNNAGKFAQRLQNDEASVRTEIDNNQLFKLW